MTKIITCEDVVPGLENLLYSEVVRLDFNAQIGTDQAGRVPEFERPLKEDEHGQAFLVTESNMMGTAYSEKNVIDFLFYPQRDFDYHAKHGKSGAELTSTLIQKTLVEILKPLHAAGQIHFTCAQQKLSNDRNAIYVRIFRADDFPCSEHPEMLLGAPLGQYHCPVCREMVIAGCFHLPREFDDEGNPTDQQ